MCLFLLIRRKLLHFKLYFNSMKFAAGWFLNDNTQALRTEGCGFNSHQPHQFDSAFHSLRVIVTWEAVGRLLNIYKIDSCLTSFHVFLIFPANAVWFVSLNSNEIHTRVCVCVRACVCVCLHVAHWCAKYCLLNRIFLLDKIWAKDWSWFLFINKHNYLSILKLPISFPFDGLFTLHRVLSLFY